MARRAGGSTVLPEEHDVLSIGDVLTVGIAQQLLDLMALVTHDPGDLGRSVVNEGSADLLGIVAAHLAVGARRSQSVDHDHAHRLVLGKITFDVDNADGKEACLANQGAVGTLINVDGSVGVESV